MSALLRLTDAVPATAGSLGTAVSREPTPTGRHAAFTVLATNGQRIRIHYLGTVEPNGTWHEDATGSKTHSPTWVTASRFFVTLWP